jgi:hypothetical protein
MDEETYLYRWKRSIREVNRQEKEDTQSEFRAGAIRSRSGIDTENLDAVVAKIVRSTPNAETIAGIIGERPQRVEGALRRLQKKRAAGMA